MASSAIGTYGSTWMVGERPWFVHDPHGRLITLEGGGFVCFDTQPEADAFAGALERGEIRRGRDGRVSTRAIRSERP